MNREQKLIEYLERFIEEHKDTPIHLIDVSLHMMTLKEIYKNFALEVNQEEVKE